MAIYFEEILLCVTYLALSFTSLSCFNIYKNNNGAEARSFPYGLYIINMMYGISGAINTASCGLKDIHLLFQSLELSLVLPFLTTEIWLQQNIFPKQLELVYIPCILGILSLFSYLILGAIRIDLLELSMLYCCICMSYIGYTTSDYMVVASSLLFYSAYCMLYRDKINVSNVLIILSTLFSLGSICPTCVEQSRKKSGYSFKEYGWQ